MVYANVALTLGAERFAAALADAGAAGAIIPDLPRERGPVDRRGAARARARADRVRRRRRPRPSGWPRIAARAPWASPTSSRSPGVTGRARPSCRPQLGELVAAVKRASDAPAAVGFGIGTPEQAAPVGSGRRRRDHRHPARPRRRRCGRGARPRRGGRRRRGSAFMADTRPRPVDFARDAAARILRRTGDVRLHRSASRSISAAPCAR